MHGRAIGERRRRVGTAEELLLLLLLCAHREKESDARTWGNEFPGALLVRSQRQRHY